MPGLVRIEDAVDILLVTALVYTAVVWLRRTRAAFAALGLLLLGGLYAVSQAFDLRLTTWLLQSFFAILVVMIVVIFQEELRQLFERLAVWSLRRGRRREPTGTVPAAVLVEALGDMARRHVGALVVLPGRQPIDRYVRGGIVLEGQLSAPLLESVFDPHSPGHDGAAIVEGDRVRRFAAHLPLSSDFTQLTGTGTRHAAALGLAEVSDALCLVVSEERGEVGAARDGRLVRGLDAAALTATLAAFSEAQEPRDRRRPFWIRLVREHGREKVASLLVVTALWWSLVPGSRPVERTYEVPVRLVNVPDDLVVQAVKPDTVRLTVEGPSREFFLFNARLLDVAVDVGLASDGRRTFPIKDDDLRYPKELTVRNVEPASVRVSMGSAPPREPPAPQPPATR